jgi:hypothetical protein
MPISCAIVRVIAVVARFMDSDIYRVGQKVYVWRRSLAPMPVVAPVGSRS